jgi:hypothetical protein
LTGVQWKCTLLYVREAAPRARRREALEQGTSPVTVVLYTVALAIGLIAFLFLGTLLIGRYMQVRTRGAWEIFRQVQELEADRRGTASRWRRLRFLVGPAALLVVLVTLVTGHGEIALPALFVTMPLALIVYGLEIREVRYYVLSLPLKPPRLLTGEEAVRIGSLYIVGGVILFIPSLALAILAGLVGLAVLHRSP